MSHFTVYVEKQDWKAISGTNSLTKYDAHGEAGNGGEHACMCPLLKLLVTCKEANLICWFSAPSTAGVRLNFLHSVVTHEWAYVSFNKH